LFIWSQARIHRKDSNYFGFSFYFNMCYYVSVVLPYLVPQLTASPVNTKALSILGSVAGEALNRHLARILPALLTSLADSHGQANEAQELQYCQVSPYG
jgi:hypothetical protein